MAKKIILCCLFVLSINSAFSVSIITDLDDTLKITNVANKPEAVWNALFNKKAFWGMPQLMQWLQPVELYIVSASPKLLNQRIEKFLDHNQLQVRQVYTRELSEMGEKEQYKLASIRNILRQSDESFILIGDNVQIDERVYQRIKKEFPTRILAIYTHRINADIAIEEIAFSSAFDIAVQEYKQQRLSWFEIMEIAKSFLLSADLATTFPRFKFCPQENIFEVQLPWTVQQTALQVYKKINRYCRTR